MFMVPCHDIYYTSVYKLVTRPSPIHGPYSLHIASTQVAGSGGYLQRHHYAFKMAESSPPDSIIVVVVEQSTIPISTWLVVTFYSDTTNQWSLTYVTHTLQSGQSLTWPTVRLPFPGLPQTLLKSGGYNLHRHPYLHHAS